MKTNVLRESVLRIGRNRWRLGTYVCEIADEKSPKITIANWNDSAQNFILRTLEDTDLDTANAPQATEPFHVGGFSSVVWEIGFHAFCKVKTWNSEIEPEAQIISYVNKVAPEIPTPEVIHAWTEHDRSFLLLKRAQGKTLESAWSEMSRTQRDTAIKTLVDYCKILAQIKGSILGSPSGKPLSEQWLAMGSELLVGPFDHGGFVRYLSNSGVEPPTIEKSFVFLHLDLSPTNIMVDNGAIVCLLDWEHAGFVFPSWLSTKLRLSPAFDFDPPIPGEVWRQILREALEKSGFPQSEHVWWLAWTERVRECLGE